MICFPQLSTGSIAQFPFARRSRYRTVVNELADGRIISWADDDARQIFWRVRFEHLSDSELATLRAFFASVEGRLKTFVFPDPAGNLLRWSTDLTRPVWQTDPLVVVSGPRPDPTGGEAAQRIANASAIDAEFRQAAALTSDYTLCSSVYLRADAPVVVTMRLQAGPNAAELQCAVTSQWQRVLLPATLGGGEESVTVGLRLPPGSEIDAYGLQLEAQASASGYKPTASQSGLYSVARFDSDRLAFTTHDENDHSVEIHIISGVKNNE